MIFSEETSRAIYAMGNMEFIELKQNIVDYSVSFLLEARTRGIEDVSMRRVASTPSKYDGTNQSSFCSVENAILSYHSNLVKREKKVDIILGRQIMPKPWMHKEEQRKTAANLLVYWTDGRTTRPTELLNCCTVGLRSTPSIDISYEAPYKQRNRYEKNTLFMRGVDPNKQAGPLCQRPDYKSSANALVSSHREQGKGVPHIPTRLRTR